MSYSRDPNEPVDALQALQDRGGRTFIGELVTGAIRRAKYPLVWRPLIQRYVELVGENDSHVDGASSSRRSGNNNNNIFAGGSVTATKAAANVRLYCDMVCTVITKKVTMVDIFYLYRPPWDENEEDVRLREVHMVTATKYLVKMSTCAYECVYGRLPDSVDMARAAALLYAEVYAEAFDVANVRESDIFRLVETWFRVQVLRIYDDDDDDGPGPLFVNVAPGIPFLVCSHVYWLWLHLTAARVRHSAQDLLTIVYALDMIVYCGDCKRHFLEHRSHYFVDDDDDAVNSNGETGACVSRVANNELLFRLHNRVNAHTGSPEMDATVLSEYKSFWEE